MTMMRTLPLAMRKRIGGDAGTPILRLYTMSDRQMAALQRAISRTNAPPSLAENAIRSAAVRMLSGSSPMNEGTHPEILKLARYFRPLTKEQIERLPRTGCPIGWIEAVVILVVTKRWSRALLFEFSRDQQVGFNDELAALAEVHPEGRDGAWLTLVHAVSRLSQGAPPQHQHEHDLADVFPKSTLVDLVRRHREATEDDLLRWAYRVDE